MSEKNLQAELDAAKKRIAELEARSPATNAEDAEKVKAIKAKAKRTPDGKSAVYLVGAVGHYREGRMYGEGEEVVIPLKENPSITFRPVLDEKKSA